MESKWWWSVGFATLAAVSPYYLLPIASEFGYMGYVVLDPSVCLFGCMSYGLVAAVLGFAVGKGAVRKLVGGFLAALAAAGFWFALFVVLWIIGYLLPSGVVQVVGLTMIILAPVPIPGIVLLASKARTTQGRAVRELVVGAEAFLRGFLLFEGLVPIGVFLLASKRHNVESIVLPGLMLQGIATAWICTFAIYKLVNSGHQSTVSSANVQ